MKKQFRIPITVFIIAAFISCSKGNNDLGEINNPDNELASAAAEKGSGSSFNPTRKLDFWFPFNGSIVDVSGQPVNATISTVGADVYAEDRFGSANGAIKFNGSYGIILNGPRISANMSASVWVKYESAAISRYFFQSPLTFGQETDKFSGSVSTPSTTGVLSNSADAGWHHLVATYDGSYMKFYVDGNFVGEKFNQGSFSGGPSDAMFWVGGAGSTFWTGTMDDLRFYTRTLSASDVQALYNL